MTKKAPTNVVGAFFSAWKQLAIQMNIDNSRSETSNNKGVD